MKKYINTASCFLLVAGLLFFASCTTNFSSYQKQVGIPGAKWDAKFEPTFKIDITDTSTGYNMYLLFRHDEAYPNSNIWMRLKVKEPGAKTFISGARIEKEIADAEGKWLGKGMAGMWEEKIYIPQEETPRFKKLGVYEIKVEHLMRTNPLPSVLNVGIRIDKKK